MQTNIIIEHIFAIVHNTLIDGLIYKLSNN